MKWMKIGIFMKSKSYKKKNTKNNGKTQRISTNDRGWGIDAVQ